MRPLVEGDRLDLGGRMLAARNALSALAFVDGTKVNFFLLANHLFDRSETVSLSYH